LLDDDRFGVVYQDARPGQHSGYSRIGWHSAARATDDGSGAIRRHLRGGWFGGDRLAPDQGLDDFVKNARR